MEMVPHRLKTNKTVKIARRFNCGRKPGETVVFNPTRTELTRLNGVDMYFF